MRNLAQFHTYPSSPFLLLSLSFSLPLSPRLLLDLKSLWKKLKKKGKIKNKMKSGFTKNSKHSNSFDVNSNKAAAAAWAAAAHSKQSSVFSPKLVIPFILFLSFIYFLYNLSLFFTSPSCPPNPITTSNSVSLPITNSSTSAADDAVSSSPPPPPPPLLSPPPPQIPNRPLDLPQRPPAPAADATALHHIVFGIAASARMWDKRKEYIKIWWRPREMRGYVWLDKPVREFKSRSPDLPTIKLSGDTSKIPYTNRQGTKFAIRISRIVSETYRLGLDNARWFVMGDDDTVFVPDNLVRVLSKLDHTQPYYIGSQSESHIQNIYFSYSMAYGGGGFAISRPLAEALSKMQDACLRRYPALYGSDDRIQACMAELGVPLTRHPGFHQYDVYGDLLGLLASHPVAPLVSLHHLDVVNPIFPGLDRAAALKKLFNGPVSLDPSAVVQQSICYESEKRWTVSVSWGFVVQIVRGVMSPREMETPARTFLNWYKRADYTAYSMNTRPVARNPCQRPYFYYLSSARKDSNGTIVTEYIRHKEKQPTCKWNMEDPSAHVDRIIVHKEPDPGLWDRSPRRNCCRVTSASGKDGKKTMSVDVGMCRAGEISQI